MRNRFAFTRTGILFLVLAVITVSGSHSWLSSVQPKTAQAASVSELQKKKKAAEEAAAKAAAEAAKKKELAATAAAKVKQVSGQITEIEGEIVETQSTIVTTQTEVERKTQQLALLESDLRRIQDQQDALVRHLYVTMVSLPDELALFSNESVSDKEKKRAQFIALKKSVALMYTQTTSAKMVVEETRTGLAKKADQLEQFKDQQGEQKKGLASYRSAQSDLQKDAVAAAAKLEAQAAQAKKDVAKIEQQIQSEISRIIASGNFAGGGPGVGTRISRGTYIGAMGCTGYCTGPHAHLELRINNSPVDPTGYLSNGTISYPVSRFTLTQGYGYTSYAQGGAYGGKPHTGLDLAAAYGTPMYAPADGTVILNKFYGGYGYAWAAKLDSDPSKVVLIGHMVAR
jgi:septal ring factor EnvC (AmiA/AmiB activator)